MSESEAEAMSERELEEIGERAEATLAGPWVRGKWANDVDIVRQEEWTPCGNPDHDDCAVAQGVHTAAVVRLGHSDAKQTAEFIAHARQDIPNLLQEVRRSHAEAAELRKKLQKMRVAEIARLGQEIEEPSYTEIYRENAELRKAIEAKDSAANAAESRYEQQYVLVQDLQTQNTELRERLEHLQGALGFSEECHKKTSAACADLRREIERLRWVLEQYASGKEEGTDMARVALSPKQEEEGKQDV